VPPQRAVGVALRTGPGAATMRRQIKDLGQAPAAALIYATCVEDSLPAPPYDPLI